MSVQRQVRETAMNKNTIYIIVAVLVIIIVVAGVVVYYYMGTGESGGGGGGGGETVYTLGNATSVQYTVNLTDPTGVGIYTFAGRNLGTADIELRVDATPVVGYDTYSYIMFATNQTSYNNETGTWAAGNFTQDWGVTWSGQFEGYISHNADWMTGDSNISYHDSAGNEVLVYDIMINPSLPDSLFQSM
jgi:hypothetical protein